MTFEEAFSIVDKTLGMELCQKCVKKECDECDICVACKKLKECTEKQIKKKPIENDFGAYCPCCKKLLFFVGLGTGNIPHHCECGQAIDWS